MTELYTEGTIAVENGSVDFVVTGGALLPVNAKKGDMLNVAGHAILLDDPADVTHGKFAIPYPGATASGLPYAVVKTSAEWGTNRTLALQTAEMIQQLAMGAVGIAVGSIPGMLASNVQAAIEELHADLDGFEVVPPDDSITNAKLANMVASTFKGRKSASTGDPEDMTASEALTVLKTAGAYAKNNILGTVSQSGGVPTGAIVERGSNANGEYVRFADGTQMCWWRYTVTITAGLYAGKVGAFPAVFAAAPEAFMTCRGFTTGPTSVFFRLLPSPTGWDGTHVTNTNETLTMSGFAIGRWF